MFRQGDILIIPVNEERPEEAKKQDDLILAHGEATGHMHQIHSGANRYLLANGDQFVEVTEDVVKVTHQEHGPITLKKGNYRVVRQREYTPQAIRNVAD